MNCIHRGKGFTLIELLIVVAIIAILAAIAIPNFLAAQVRSKVSRAKSEIRTLCNATQAYFVDNNEFPRATGWYGPVNIIPDKKGSKESYYRYSNPVITTPIAYITSVPTDPFNVVANAPQHYAYYAEPRNSVIIETGGATWFKLFSVGPDGYWNLSFTPFLPTMLYDPSNGTVSNGDIQRLGGETWWAKDENRD